MYGDRGTGVISGSFAQSGIYTFGCEVADQLGNSAEGFVTITVLDIHASTELNNVQLETRVTYRFDLKDIRKEQIAADRE